MMFVMLLRVISIRNIEIPIADLPTYPKEKQ